MGNKRGIPQAFNKQPDGLELRRATVFDVFEMSDVLIRSITRLCAADHEDDPQVLAEWTANKTPETLRDGVQSGSVLWVADYGGQVAAVGGLRMDEITLLYVDPNHTGRGLGVAMLNQLEQEITSAGHPEAHLEATRTAQDFYRKNGWVATGQCSERNDLSCFAMRKSLHPTD
ncbi:GNAT family N-acetyltransferase [uncultured Ruegeria sp.]|uniref:GNAT family N-acetyltransferase n=1 Tax=uncultured Ruegeria sp. TaxID=259304 RepID=UPI00262E9546|nr:GNAT family N-acetyltransferase [uncultured Ruegeria sp.]